MKTEDTEERTKKNQKLDGFCHDYVLVGLIY